MADKPKSVIGNGYISNKGSSRFCLIKVLTIIVFIIISICIISGGIGGTVYGVKYFASDVGGGPFKDGFVGILNGRFRSDDFGHEIC